MDPKARNRPSWGSFLGACAYLGVTGFGGGLAILAQAGDLFEKRRWLTGREWVHTATVAQLLPGGAATNALAFAGLRFFGWMGAVGGVFVYIAPSGAAMIALGILYGKVHSVPHLDALLAGFNGAVVGLVVAVTWRLGQAGLRRGWQAVLAALSLALERLGHATVLEVIVLGIAAGLAADSLQKGIRLRSRRLVQRRGRPSLPGEHEDGTPAKRPEAPEPEVGDPTGERAEKRDEPPKSAEPPEEPSARALLLPFASRGIFKIGLGPLTAPFALAVLFTFARVGAVAYGGGFTIVPLLEREAVEQHHWISAQELADAIAFGQVTPGPVMICASFIGARAGGVVGGLMATLGVFGVPVLLTIATGVWLDRWRRTRAVKAALRGLLPAVVGMMAAAAVGLAGAGIRDEVGVILAAVAFVAVVQFKSNPALVVLAAGVLRVLLLITANL